MPKRLWSYRSGDIKENLGFVLLQGIGFVSPTPRTEDVGVDAAVFLQRPEGRSLHPESGFYVQIKSSEIDRIEFDEEATLQLLGLDLPYYIALVDGPKGEVTLHSLNHLFQSFWWGSPITITLDKSNKVIQAAKNLSGGFGEPLMHWGLQDVFDQNFRAKAHKVLSAYLEVDMANITLSSLGIFRHYNVATNAMPVGVNVNERRIERFPGYTPASDIVALQTVLTRLMFSIMSKHPELEEQVMKLMALYADTMKKAGLEPYFGAPFECVVEQVRNAIRSMTDLQRAHQPNNTQKDAAADEGKRRR